MKNLCCCFGIILFLFSLSAVGGVISYSALGNFDMRQGTIEMWLIPQVDLMAEEMFRKVYWRYPLFLAEQNDSSFQLAWLVRKGKSSPVALHVVEKTRLSRYLPVEKWDKGQPRHIAYCWEEGVDWWVIDGTKLPEVRNREWHRTLTDGRLRILLGHQKAHGIFVIDDLRISSVARRESELGFHRPGGLKPDPWTLLLDNFDTTVGSGNALRTAPPVMAPAPDGSTGGIPDSDCKFVPGVSGNGLRL